MLFHCFLHAYNVRQHYAFWILLIILNWHIFYLFSSFWFNSWGRNRRWIPKLNWFQPWILCWWRYTSTKKWSLQGGSSHTTRDWEWTHHGLFQSNSGLQGKTGAMFIESKPQVPLVNVQTFCIDFKYFMFCWLFLMLNVSLILICGHILFVALIVIVVLIFRFDTNIYLLFSGDEHMETQFLMSRKLPEAFVSWQELKMTSSALPVGTRVPVMEMDVQ